MFRAHCQGAMTVHPRTNLEDLKEAQRQPGLSGSTTRWELWAHSVQALAHCTMHVE